MAAAAEVQVAMKRNADEEARLTGERCEVMDERAELEAMGKDLKRDAELLCEEREVFESENEAFLRHLKVCNKVIFSFQYFLCNFDDQY